MVKRIAAILFIFACTCVAWAVLGGTILARTYSADESIRGQVESLWGAPQVQLPPTATYEQVERRVEKWSEDHKEFSRVVENKVVLPLDLAKSRVTVNLALDHRQKGLLWYSAYQAEFAGEYSFKNPANEEKVFTFKLPFPTKESIYDNISFAVNGAPIPFSLEQNAIVGSASVAAGQTAVLRAGYRSQGLDRWSYSFGTKEVNDVRDFELQMKTNFRDIDFPGKTLSPTEKKEIEGGWQLRWSYASLLSGAGLGMVMPEKLQPGPLAGQISFFAPVSLFFFFFLLFIITTLRDIEMHPMNYFFLAAAFFAFHLLLAYLVDHISIHAAFGICSAVSIFLVISYLRLVVGMRFAAVEAGITQFVYLVLFSYAFFFKGLTGLAVTIGSIVTLFVVMQMTGRIRWAEKFTV